MSSGRGSEDMSWLRGVPLGEGALLAAVLGTMTLLCWGKLEKAQSATRYAETISDLRIQLRAVEAYAVDTADYPRMAWGDLSGHGFPFFRDYYAGSATYGSLTMQISTPIAYLPTQVEDPVLTETGGFPALYTYHAPDTHTFIFNYIGSIPVPGSPGFIYSPASPNATRRMRQYCGEYVLWGCGPAGATAVTSSNYWLQFDPTNGATSAGNAYISQKFARPTYVSPSAF